MVEDKNYTIAEDYELPSKGLIYSGKNVNPRVRLRSMTTRDEMKRLSHTETPYKTLAELIESCMLEKPAVSVYDMALGDYEYLLHKLRVVTYGPDYKMTVGCPNCQELVDSKVNLDDLKTLDFDLDAFEEASTLTLPRSKKRIVLRYQTPRMLDDIELAVKEYRRKNKNAEFDVSLLINLKYLIKTVEGQVLSFSELENFINNLPAADSNYIMQKAADMNSMIGLDTEINVVCPKCGEDIITRFRFGPEFFRPSIS